MKKCTQDISAGVTQDSVLGPNIFSCFINDTAPVISLSYQWKRLPNIHSDQDIQYAVSLTLYINELDEGTEGILAKFADDSKISRGTSSIKDVGRLQKDLDRLGEWGKKWQREYNVGNCDGMYFGKKIRSMDYFLNGEKIQKSEVQRDLGVLVQDSL
eukprot:g18375.t1